MLITAGAARSGACLTRANQVLPEIFSEVALPEIVCFHTRSDLREFAHGTCACARPRNPARFEDNAGAIAPTDALDTPCFGWHYLSNATCLTLLV